jgi:sec-independent protein translocase protein TatA
MFASPWKDTLIILVIVLLFVGPKRLPALSRSIGESIKEFKGGISEISGSHGSADLTTGADAAGVTTPAASAPAASAPVASAPAASPQGDASLAAGAPRDQAGA